MEFNSAFKGLKPHNHHECLLLASLQTIIIIIITIIIIPLQIGYFGSSLSITIPTV